MNQGRAEMGIGEEDMGREKRSVVVGIGFDGHTRELLDWAVVKVADPGDCVVALHVCRNSDSTSKAQALMDDYLDEYKDLCHQKQVGLAVEVVKGSSIRKLLVREAKNRAAVAVIVGINKNSLLGGRVSIAKHCAKRLPLTTEVMAIHNGKVVYRRCCNDQQQQPGSQGDPKPSLYLNGNPTCTECPSEFGDSEISDLGRLSHEVCQSSECGCTEADRYPRDESVISPTQRRKRSSLSSISLPVEDFTQQRPGWPLLQTASAITQPSVEARKMTVVQWVMSLPNRSLLEIPQNALGRTDNVSVSAQPPSDLELLLSTKSPGCKLFSHETLKSATSQFCSDNLIGKGGCNCVYKGILPDGKPVAVKILKSSKEAWKEFSLEVDIMTTLKHRSITPLLGICISDNDLISVYDFVPKGNLEENIHGTGKERFVLPWEVRFKIAIGVAEALNYLHSRCARPVIHRDVKSSNILLADEFEPQLSDFGLAIWGPTKASFITDCDVVGTFGYLAPEYFMYGKVSEKVDVYSFGVVLLELLSGRKPIGFDTSKGRESLVIWAKPKLESGDVKGILDQNLDDNFDESEMHRMALAAKLCLTQAARVRPKMSQILKILTGEEHLGEEISTELGANPENQGDYDDDEVYPDSSAESHLSLALLDVCDNSTSFSSQDQSSPLSVEDYLRRRWSRSSSLE
ncbi:unnamed protein product [Coffea canephora]|uniref:Protein kinase domain-containing protein n=1 Tax=Coffea canephora TaxID=49390 RepID=A0A068V221_COFCA|nr:unnamed protein product [Coffea canephora]